jgi:hypothetical protein
MACDFASNFKGIVMTDAKLLDIQMAVNDAILEAIEDGRMVSCTETKFELDFS